MKEFLLACFFVLGSFYSADLTTTSAATAQYEYACILLPNTYLYAAEDPDTGLFVLPQTYYVKVLETGVTHCYVEYAAETDYYRAVRGYCLTSELYFVDFLPERTFVNYTFSLTYKLEGFTGSMVSSGFLSELSRTCAYYGDYRIGSSDYCYVYMDGQFGYVPKPTGVSYPLNYDYLAPEPTEETDPDETKASAGFLTEETLKAVKIVSIAVLSVLGVLTIYLAIRLNAKRKPPQPARDWYEE